MKRTAAETRNLLFDAAANLFRELGYETVTHADIAAEANIGRTTFYEHFTSKEDLLVRLVQRDLPDLIDGMLADVDRTLPVDERLRALTVRFVEFVGTDHLGLILQAGALRLSDEARVAIAASHRALANEVMGIYRDGVAGGVFAALPEPVVGRLIQETMMSGGRVVMETPEPERDIRAVAEATARFLVNGLRA